MSVPAQHTFETRKGEYGVCPLLRAAYVIATASPRLRMLSGTEPPHRSKASVTRRYSLADAALALAAAMTGEGGGASVITL